MGYLDQEIERHRHKKTSFSRILVRMLEVTAVVLSFLGSSRIARFLSAKVTMDVLVEVTDKFGTRAGHNMSTVVAAIVAEPMIIAYTVAGIVVAANLIALLVRALRRRHRHRRRRENDVY